VLTHAGALVGHESLFQFGAIGLLIRQVVRAGRNQNLELSLDQAIDERFGRSPFANVLRLESRIWLYGLVRRPVHHAFPGIRHFHVGQQGMNASNQSAFLVLIGAELPIAHILIHLFSPAVAIVITALSAYGFVFMLAEYRASLYRPLSITEQGLKVRYGVTSDFLIGWDAIVAAAPTRGAVCRAPGRMRLIGMGEANVVIDLAPGTRIAGLFGSREIAQICLGVDDPAGMIREIQARRR
jgi:hypothetical protein